MAGKSTKVTIYYILFIANIIFSFIYLKNKAILSEEDKVVVIRFGHDWDPTCMKMDEVLYKVAE